MSLLTCLDCDGTGLKEPGHVCVVCDGTGEVEHEECACERCCGAMAGWAPEGVES